MTDDAFDAGNQDDPFYNAFREPPGSEALKKVVGEELRVKDNPRCAMTRYTMGEHRAALKELVRLAQGMVDDKEWLEMASIVLKSDD